jgi:hypothetical protein
MQRGKAGGWPRSLSIFLTAAAASALVTGQSVAAVAAPAAPTARSVAAPTERGPYTTAGAPAGSATASMTAQTEGFDPAVTSASGDFWLFGVNPSYSLFSPVVINPGQTATIDVTITAPASAGTVVTGVLYVDDYTSAVPYLDNPSGDELAAFPYEYTVGS